ncbi:retrovirus-related pol polyprotein from transposon TNT 1-94 [Tanacetum coccineum]
MVKHEVEIETVGECVDEIDKLAKLIGKHEADQHWPLCLERVLYTVASRFRRYLNRKRDNQKWLLKALNEGPYEFKNFIPEGSTIPRLQTAEDLEGDDLLLHDAEMEVMNMILLSIPNEIYNFVDACTSAGYVETMDSFDDLFDYLQQLEKLANASRAKKSSSLCDVATCKIHYSKISLSNNNRLRASSNTRNQAIIQGDMVNIQSRNSGNTGRNSRRAYVQEEVIEGMNALKETGNVQRTLRTPSLGNTSTVQCYNCSGKGHYARNCPKPRVRDSKYFMEQMLLAKQDEAGVILTDEQNDFLFADASWMEEIEELSANICLMARIQPADHTSDDGPSYESAFISEVQSLSINENNKRMYPTHTKIINSTIGDDQINSNIKFDSFKGNVNSGSVEKDTHVPDLCAVEKLARNAYQEAEKQQIFAQQVQKQNTHLTSQLEMYKERNLFQRDIKEMKDAFEQNDVYLDEIERQNDLLKYQLLEASLKHDIEPCVLLNHECVDKTLNDELEQVKKKSLEIQKGLKARIKILEKDVQRCEKQSVDFKLKLQHEKENHKWDSSKNKNSKPLDYSWISRMEKLENENVSLDFKVQSLIKERDDVKMEYKKLFNSIKKTQSQTQIEMDELIAHVSEKTYAYGAIRAENQNLLSTISELKARMKNCKNGKSVNTKFDKTNGSQSFLCVTPLNKNAFQKQTVVSKTKEIHVESKPVTLQTLPHKQIGANQNTNVIRLGIINATSSVRRPLSRDSHVKNIVLDVSKNAAKKEEVYVRKNKQTDNKFANFDSNKENVIDVDVANASKAKTLLCVSCMQDVLIPCHDKCVAKHKLNVRSNARRTFSTTSRIPKSSETTFVAPKTRFSEKETQSKTLDTTSVVFKSKIDVESASNAKDKVSSASKIKKRNPRDKPLSPFMINKIRASRIWQKWFESQPNVIWTPVNTKPQVHTNPSSAKPLVPIKKWVVKLPSCPCVAFSYVAVLDNFVMAIWKWLFVLIRVTYEIWKEMICSQANAILICILSPFLTWLLLHPLDLVDGLPKFKYGKDHLCSACERRKSKKASHSPKLVLSVHSKLELLHMDLCGPMRVASINGKRYILVIMDDYSRYTWVYFLRSKDETPEFIKKFIAQAQ